MTIDERNFPYCSAATTAAAAADTTTTATAASPDSGGGGGGGGGGMGYWLSFLLQHSLGHTPGPVEE